MAKDPVCGMQVDEKKVSRTSTFAEHTYYFCSDGCKKRFDQEPAKFTEAAHPGHPA